MSACEQLSERMPAVAGGAEWNPVEAAHLEVCAECSAEWTLVRAARGLGVGCGKALNAHHVSDRVLGRLRADHAATRARRRGLALAGLAAAASLALVVWTGGAERGVRGPAQAVAAADLSVVELDSLRAPELEVLLRSMELADDNDPVHVIPSLLEDGGLDRVLEALEG
jgi:hypothetical protein